MVQTSISTWLTKPNEPARSPRHNQTNIALPTPPNPIPSTNVLPSQPDESQDEDTTKEDSLNDSSKESKKTFRLKPLPLPPNASLSTINSEHISAYQRMTALLLPIPYPKKFFEETVEDPITASICSIALWSQPSGDKVVSGIRCRLLARSPALPQERGQENDPEESPSLYIAALTTLAPYRGHGLASALFRRILSRAIREYGVTTVTAHRWEVNEEARSWYARHGFKEVGFANDYYRRLKPSGAFLLERRIGPQDLLGDDEEDENRRT